MQSGFQELLDEFMLEARERADEVESMLLRLRSDDPEVRDAAIARTKRELHTLKGNSGMMGFSDLQELAHRMEDQVEDLDLDSPEISGLLSELDALRQGLEKARSANAELGAIDGEAAAEEQAADEAETESSSEARDSVGGSVRVPFAKIDQLVEMQAETLIFRNRLSDSVRQGLVLTKLAELDAEEFVNRSIAAWEDVEIAQQELEKTLNLLQEKVTNLGMVPLLGLFRPLRRIVHDESASEGKKVELVIEGGETPIDKTLLEIAGDALGHLIRNAVIHGIETPAERLRQGKSEGGTIQVKATLEGGEVWIEVTDDGSGVDVAGLKSRAKELLGDSYESGSDLALLFAEGLSTRQGTDLSAGRGVGLAAVKKSVERHGGRVDVRSQRNVGTSFSLRLPVTASILRSLLLQVDAETYALPLSSVIETTRLSVHEHHRVNQAQVIRWRGQLVPLLDLGLAFATSQAPREDGFVVLIEVHGRFRGLVIDAIIGIHDIVVKGLDTIVGQPVGISGSTILGDGRVVMILDPAALAATPPFVEARS
ncbi:MAG: chemotaxis protein CheW [Acidobacteriota bacterium]